MICATRAQTRSAGKVHLTRLSRSNVHQPLTPTGVRPDPPCASPAMLPLRLIFLSA